MLKKTLKFGKLPFKFGLQKKNHCSSKFTMHCLLVRKKSCICNFLSSSFIIVIQQLFTHIYDTINENFSHNNSIDVLKHKIL